MESFVDSQEGGEDQGTERVQEGTTDLEWESAVNHGLIGGLTWQLEQQKLERREESRRGGGGGA